MILEGKTGGSSGVVEGNVGRNCQGGVGTEVSYRMKKYKSQGGVGTEWEGKSSENIKPSAARTRRSVLGEKN